MSKLVLAIGCFPSNMQGVWRDFLFLLFADFCSEDTLAAVNSFLLGNRRSESF